jgi:hypothetical protein
LKAAETSAGQIEVGDRKINVDDVTPDLSGCREIPRKAVSELKKIGEVQSLLLFPSLPPSPPPPQYSYILLPLVVALVLMPYGREDLELCTKPHSTSIL